MKNTDTLKLFRKADVLCILLSVILAILCLFLFNVFFPDSEEAELKIVTEDGTKYYSLNTDRTVEIYSNEISVTVQIKNGEAWIEHSTCPDGVCRSMGKLNRNGQIAVCAPAKVAITVIAEQGGETDAITR